jgi:hypothetical protein
MTLPAYTTNDESWLADISGGLSIYGDLSKNTTKGDVAAGSQAAKTFGKGSEVGEAGGIVSGGLEIQQGLQHGGVVGDTEAAIGAGQIGLSTGLINAGSSVGGAIPVAGSALATYEFAKNWQSGASGADAMGGASAGAAIGTAIEPGVGTLAGLVIGGAVGAVSSMFGPGKQDPETANWNSYAAYYDKHGAAGVAGATPSQNFQLLSGIFDSRGGGANSIPFYAKYGRQGESAFTTDMATQINQALASGKISPSTPAAQVYQTVVQPWINGMEPGGWKDAKTSKGQPTKAAMGNMLTSLIQQYMGGQLTSSSKLGVSGQSIPQLPPVGAMGTPASAAAAKAAVAAQTAQYNQSLTAFPTAAASGGTSAITSLALLFPAIFAGASAMPTGLPTSTTNDPTLPDSSGGAGGAATTGGTDPSSLLTDINSFLSSPAGGVAEFGTLAGLGLAEANSQKKTNDSLAQSLATPGQPYTAAGSAELSQLQGGPQVGGPLGASIAQQTSAASNLGNVAKQYSTGQLTSAQNSQVQDFIKQQRAMVDTQLAQSGNTDSSARQAAYQQIDDNAAQLTQQLTQQNTQIASAALTSVQQTYSTLLTQALNSSEFGFTAQEAAVMTQIQSDTQLSGQLQQLFGALAQGYGNAMSGGAAGKKAGGGGAGNAAGQIAKAVGGATGGGGSGVASSAAGGGSENDQSAIQDPDTITDSNIGAPGSNLQGGYSDYSAIQDPNADNFTQGNPFAGGYTFSNQSSNDWDPFTSGNGTS